MKPQKEISSYHFPILKMYQAEVSHSSIPIYWNVIEDMTSQITFKDDFEINIMLQPQ